MTRINRRLVITGHVQGVWYRKSAADQGLGLGLCGTVRNLQDGSVEVVVEGEEGAVEQFIDWCRQGPPKARVAGVEIQPGTVQGFNSFETIR